MPDSVVASAHLPLMPSRLHFKGTTCERETGLVMEVKEEEKGATHHVEGSELCEVTLCSYQKPQVLRLYNTWTKTLL